MDDRYMMATRAEHLVGDISRDKPHLAVIYGEADDCWIGEWVTGVAFVNVKFPKATTRDLTDEERTTYAGKVVVCGGVATPLRIGGESE